MQRKSSSEPRLKPKFHLNNSRLQVYAQNAIKRSNVKAFVNQTIRTSQGFNVQNNEGRNLSHHLLHLKNSCNDLNKDITNKENDSVKLKDSTVYTQQKVKQLQTQRQILEEKIANLTKDVEMVQTKKQATFHSFKTYEHIMWRMKKDEITNQIRRNYLQKQIHNMEKQAKLTQNKLYSLKQYEELSLKGYKQAEEEIWKENQQRLKKVTEMNSFLDQKRISELKKKERQNQTELIQQMAAGDLQDADLIRMKKFLSVQVFLRSVLKDKMQRLKNFYEPFQMAFLKIKSQTSVKDANALKSQFFNFESQYQERTVWIKHLEGQIAGLQAQRKQLNEELYKAKQKELDLLEQYEDKRPSQHKNHDESPENDKLHIYQRSLDSELVMMKVKQWVNFQSKRVSTSHPNNLQTSPSVAYFGGICDFLLQSKKKQDNQQQTQNTQIKP